jgi:transketolase
LLYLDWQGHDARPGSRGFQLTRSALRQSSRTSTKGIETTGLLPVVGIATAVGMALAEKMLVAEFQKVVGHHTYVLASDGDLMEWRAAATMAGHWKSTR